MRTVGSYEAKTNLSRLLDEVSAGERITITRHGVPVAHLVPVDEAGVRDRREVFARIREFRKGRRGSSREIRQWIEEGRRY